MKGTTKGGAIVYDDYAHHPTEILASLEALRELYPKGEKKITILFQPHLYSRTKAFFDGFTTAFNDADAVYFLPIFFAREEPDPTVSSEKLAKAVAKNVKGSKAFSTFEEARSILCWKQVLEREMYLLRWERAKLTRSEISYCRNKINICQEEHRAAHDRQQKKQ